jgi:DNA invertase Pin-like site-specific DNA recombinase
LPLDQLLLGHEHSDPVFHVLARAILALVCEAEGVAAIDHRFCRSKRGAGFKSLADTWADTTTAHGRLMLTILGGPAEFERELIRARTGEGRTRAKAAGVHMGRPSKLTQHQQREAIARRDAGEALTDIARTFGVSHTTIGRLVSAAAMG